MQYKQQKTGRGAVTLRLYGIELSALFGVPSVYCGGIGRPVGIHPKARARSVSFAEEEIDEFLSGRWVARVAFAAFGSSRYLVVAADSATAAILAVGLSPIAPVASEHYVALAGLVALLTGGCLLLARLFKLGFLADFLSQTVLVGFLTGVGFQVGIAMLGEMLGVPVNSNRTVEQLGQVARSFPRLHVPTLCLAGAVVALVLVLRRLAPRLPGPFFAVVGAITASAAFDFSGH